MSTNPYDAAVDRALNYGGPARVAGGALHDSAPLDPDKEAEYRDLARRSGLPIETVRNAPSEARIAVIRREFATPEGREALRRAPNASQWLSQRNNAAVARDDVGVLAQLGQRLLGNAAVTFPAATLAIGAGYAVRRRVSRPGYFRGASQDFSPRNAASGVGRSLAAGAAGVASSFAGVVEALTELEDTYSPGAWIERKIFGGTTTNGLLDLARRRRQGWAEVQQAVRPETRSQFGGDVLAGVESVPGALLAAAVTLGTAPRIVATAPRIAAANPWWSRTPTIYPDPLPTFAYGVDLAATFGARALAKAGVINTARQGGITLATGNPFAGAATVSEDRQ